MYKIRLVPIGVTNKFNDPICFKSDSLIDVGSFIIKLGYSVSKIYGSFEATNSDCGTKVTLFSHDLGSDIMVVEFDKDIGSKLPIRDMFKNTDLQTVS